MTKLPLPFVVEDVSTFASTLRREWPDEKPTQTQMLAVIAKAAGYRNHQHLRAQAEAIPALDRLASLRVRDALRCFDDAGHMTRWPQKTSVQRLCMAWCWSRLPARQDLSEKEVNEVLQTCERFGDHVLLRRSLIDHRLAKRSIDGATYRRIERKPDAEEIAVIKALSDRHLVLPP